MNPRDRVLSAIQHQVPDRIPIDAIHIENTSAIAVAQNIPETAVFDFLGIDGRIVAAPYLPRNESACATPQHSEWGTPDTGDYGTQRTYPLSHAASLSDVQNYTLPDPARYDYSSAATAAAQLGQTYAVRGPYWKPLFCQVCDLVGLETAMMMLKSDPVVFEALLDRVFTYTYAYCQCLLEACGPHLPILCLGDDFATQRGLMIDPVDWRRFLKPRFAKLFELGKSRGKFIWFHSCGDITSILPDLIDIGLDVWETVQLHTLPMSPEKLKQEFGKHMTFFGGINTQRMPFASPSEVADETIRCIEALGSGGGYICGPDHHIKPDVSAESTIALFSTAQAYRKEGYTLE